MLYKGRMTTHSSFLTWEIPWMEQCGRLQFTVARVGHNWSTKEQQQYYVSFCSTTKWVGCMYTYSPSLLNHPPTLYPTSLGHHRAPSLAPCAMHPLPTSYLFYKWSCVYVRATFSIHPTLPFLLCPHVHSLICVSIPILQIVSAVLIFLDPICMLIYGFCFSLSDLLHSVWHNLVSSTPLQMTQFIPFLDE